MSHRSRVRAPQGVCCLLQPAYVHFNAHARHSSRLVAPDLTWSLIKHEHSDAEGSCPWFAAVAECAPMAGPVPRCLCGSLLAAAPFLPISRLPFSALAAGLGQG